MFVWDCVTFCGPSQNVDENVAKKLNEWQSTGWTLYQILQSVATNGFYVTLVAWRPIPTTAAGSSEN